MLELDGQRVPANVLANSCNYTPLEPLAAGTHQVKLTVKNVNGDEAVRAWVFTIYGEVTPEGADIEQKEVMNLPIIGQVSKGLGIFLIVCVVVVLLVIGVFAAIKLIGALRKKDDDTEPHLQK